MSALHALIREHECDDPADTAAAVMSAIGLAKRHRDLFFPLLRDECRRLARSAARIAERGTIDLDHRRGDTHHLAVEVDEEAGSGHPASDTQRYSARASFLAVTFYTGTAYVTWGDATAADHLGRITFQQSLASGIGRDIARHQRAVELLDEHDVDCLGEIDGIDVTDLLDADEAAAA